MLRFGKDDLKNGSISLERFREIVKFNALKLDERLHKFEDIQRISSRLLSDLEANIQFNKAETSSNLAMPDSFEFKDHFNKIAWCTAVVRNNRRLMEHEAYIFHEINEKLLQELEASMEALEKDKSEQRIGLSSYEAGMKALLLERLRLLQLEREQLLNQLMELQRERQFNLEAIKGYQKLIRVARKKCIDEMTQNAAQVQWNGVYTFEGMSNQQISNFMQGFVAIEEVKRRELAEIDTKYTAEIQAVRDDLKAAIARDPENAKTLTENSKQKERRINDKWKKEREIVIDKAEKLHIKNGDRTGCKHINSKNVEEAKKHINAVKEDPKNKESLEAFHTTSDYAIKNIKKHINSINVIDNKSEQTLNKLMENNTLLKQSIEKDIQMDVKIKEVQSALLKLTVSLEEQQKFGTKDVADQAIKTHSALEELKEEIQVKDEGNLALMASSEDLSASTADLDPSTMNLDLQIDLSDVDLSAMGIDGIDFGDSLDDLILDSEEIQIAQKEEEKPVSRVSIQ